MPQLAKICGYGRLRPSRRNSTRGWFRCTDGASAIEFAIVLPIFLLIVVGIIVYGVYLGAAHSVAQLAADSARASIAGLSDPERSSLARAHVAANAGAYPLLRTGSVSVDAGPAAWDSNEFRVVVRFDAAQLPIWMFSRLLPMPDKIIERTSTIKRGGY